MNAKKTLTALFAAAALGSAAIAWAAQEAPAAPAAPEAAVQTVAPKISLAQAGAIAEKALGGQTHRATLRAGASGGLVWDVVVIREDGTRVRTFINAETGEASEGAVMNGRGMRAPRMAPGYGEPCPYAQDGYYGPHHRRGCGMGDGYGPRHGWGHGWGHGNRNCPWW
ncbi:PepSY domain-containing protein [Sutterella massiliensis]|uniref:PepSY domain-containing protein n=1 Tax=Sutterella massiliensis TaxID=1816689 RepID=A0ABS2DU11_9BURK|nr:PepSY domain-containing protein [Sutterella massiliensis]MBM6704810.1 PepSY domain-containing protein [Sutterella massiliensis]